MKKINWKNVGELIGIVVAFVLSAVCLYKSTTVTDIPLNYFFSSMVLNFIWLSLGYDVYEKIRG